MEGLPELIMREGERRDVRDVLKQNKHALITMSQSIVPQTEDHPSSAASHSTELLQAIQRLLCMNGSPLAVSVLLAIQAEELPSMPQIHQTFTNLGLQHIANISIVHAQSCHQELVVISHALVDLLSAQRLSYLLITPLLQLARAMAPSPDCLTAIHADVLQACLASRHYSTAVDFIDRNIISEISPQECYLPSIDYLRFFFYAGCALLPLRRYEEALGYFTTAITAPANALSHVVIHAIKKARLTSLLVTGADLVLPQWTSAIVARFFKSSTGTSPSYSAVYTDIVSGFVDGNHEAIERAIQSGKAALMEDGNLGLAKLVLARLSRFKLLKLTKVYSSIPLHRVQIICGFESVEAVENAMVRMVATGEIRAKIDKASAMVYFVDSEDDYDSSDSRHELTPGRDNRDADLRRIMGEKLEEAMRMSDKLQALQQRLLSSKSYVMKAAPRAGTKEGAGVTALPGEDVDMDF